MTTALLLAHPDLAASRADRALFDGLSLRPGLEVADLYALYPSGRIDLATERERVLRARRMRTAVADAVRGPRRAQSRRGGTGASGRYLQILGPRGSHASARSVRPGTARLRGSGLANGDRPGGRDHAVEHGKPRVAMSYPAPTMHRRPTRPLTSGRRYPGSGTP